MCEVQKFYKQFERADYGTRKIGDGKKGVFGQI